MAGSGSNLKFHDMTCLETPFKEQTVIIVSLVIIVFRSAAIDNHCSLCISLRENYPNYSKLWWLVILVRNNAAVEIDRFRRIAQHHRAPHWKALGKQIPNPIDPVAASQHRCLSVRSHGRHVSVKIFQKQPLGAIDVSYRIKLSRCMLLMSIRSALFARDAAKSFRSFRILLTCYPCLQVGLVISFSSQLLRSLPPEQHKKDILAYFSTASIKWVSQDHSTRKAIYSQRQQWRCWSSRRVVSLAR